MQHAAFRLKAVHFSVCVNERVFCYHFRLTKLYKSKQLLKNYLRMKTYIRRVRTFALGPNSNKGPDIKSVAKEKQKVYFI